ncbi:MAG: glycoside hydrolase family 108 protein [Paludibacteraceae bacterium]
MANFKTAFQKMLIHEGSYSNDPIDLGGETYKGIARNAHPNWSGWTIIDKYKKSSGFPESLYKDTQLQEMIEQFYLTNFWKPLNTDNIQSQTSADSIFDFAVNTGVKTSVRLVQTIVKTETDGVIGKQTLEKLNNYNPLDFQTAFTLAKIKYYISIIKKRPANKKFLYGWITRSLEY